MLNIGHYRLNSRTILAPMAGVTDRPFRMLCRDMGAAMAVSEMISADKSLWNTGKSLRRMNHKGETEPRSVQIAGSEADMLADTARHAVQQGAQIVDINMGCPAKKVCRKAAGSALLRDEKKVADILTAVVNAVDVPVTLKIRTGWDQQHKNACKIAVIAEQEGIKALAVHGRTRACAYQGDAEYDTIAEVKQRVSIPVIANGDITSAEKAKYVLEYTKADALMIGRAAQGRPWIFREINQYIASGESGAAPDWLEQQHIIRAHINQLYAFYGEHLGVRIARKHVGWYLQDMNDEKQFRIDFNRLQTTADQLSSLNQYFENVMNGKGKAA